MHFGAYFYRLSEALETVCLVLLPLKQAWTWMVFWWCNGSWDQRVATRNRYIFEPCEQLNSKWLIAESRTDDCWKAHGTLNPQPWCPWQAGAGRCRIPKCSCWSTLKYCCHLRDLWKCARLSRYVRFIFWIYSELIQQKWVERVWDNIKGFEAQFRQS